jgi:hypothetical protein
MVPVSMDIPVCCNTGTGSFKNFFAVLTFRYKLQDQYQYGISMFWLVLKLYLVPVYFGTSTCTYR